MKPDFNDTTLETSTSYELEPSHITKPQNTQRTTHQLNSKKTITPHKSRLKRTPTINNTNETIFINKATLYPRLAH